MVNLTADSYIINSHNNNVDSCVGVLCLFLNVYTTSKPKVPASDIWSIFFVKVFHSMFFHDFLAYFVLFAFLLVVVNRSI